jgi:hypothetical protein
VYPALWRILPGPAWLRILFVIVLAVIVLAVLVTWVFPWVDAFISSQDVTVRQ